MFKTPEVTAMYEQILSRSVEAAVITVNAAADKIYERSQVEVPKSGAHEPRIEPGYPEQALEESGHIDYATAESPVAQIGYESPYAVSQHEGHMVYENSRSGREVDWTVTHYTTPGTKAKYLEDPAKAIVGTLPEDLAVETRITLGETGLLPRGNRL